MKPGNSEEEGHGDTSRGGGKSGHVGIGPINPVPTSESAGSCEHSSGGAGAAAGGHMGVSPGMATSPAAAAATLAVPVAAGASPSNTATALASAQGDFKADQDLGGGGQVHTYVEGQGSGSEEGGDDVTYLVPSRPSTRVGQAMEVQGCDPASCDYICTECDWEACIVVADDGTFCNVKLADGTVCSGVNSKRFLRYPPSSKRARR